MYITLKRLFFKLLKKTPADMPMVRYWKTANAVQAKVMTAKDGSTVMQMDGEDHIFPGFPRGHLLYGKLSKLKHEVKNQIFNDSWAALEAGISEETVAWSIRENILLKIAPYLHDQKFDIVPPSAMCTPVKEIHRAWTKIATSQKSLFLRDLICHILQEDDAYRFRVQWLTMWFNPSKWYMRLLGRTPVTQLESALTMLETAEVIGDMKERIRLLKRIILAVLKDPVWRSNFDALCREIDWKKLQMSEADKYFFRAKWFKVDLDKFDY